MKHRNTGKWAKQIQMHAKRDPKVVYLNSLPAILTELILFQTKEALQEQLRISRELLEKKTLGDDDEMQPNEEEMIIDEDNTADVTMDSENPWMKANSMREESK